MFHLNLRFENMPERHAELAWRFGEPDESFESEREDGQGSRWVLVSPLPPTAGLPEHLQWASGQLHPHEAFVRELVTLGGQVTLRLHVESQTPTVQSGFSARLLLPMAHAGMQIEMSFGLAR